MRTSCLSSVLFSLVKIRLSVKEACYVIGQGLAVTAFCIPVAFFNAGTGESQFLQFSKGCFFFVVPKFAVILELYLGFAFNLIVFSFMCQMLESKVMLLVQ